MPKPDASRRRTMIGMVLIVVIVGSFTYHFWPRNGGAPALPRVLAVILDDLSSESPHRRATAREDCWSLLVDPIRSSLGIRMSRIERVIPSEWFVKSGAPIITEALLGHFDEGWEEDEAHDLLAALVELYPEACRWVAVANLQGTLDPTLSDREIDGVAIAREISNGTPLGSYLCYRLEATDSPIRTLTAAALLTAYRRPASSSVRQRWIRLLRRVPDRDLRPIALLNRGPDRWIDPKWVELARDRGLDYRDMDDWCERGDHEAARRALLETRLGSADGDARNRGLDRFRWDPLPDLDGEVFRLATSDDAEIRRAAIRALPGIPTARGGAVIAAALDDPQLRDAAVRAARGLTGGSFGLRGDGWNVGLDPVAHVDALDEWRALIARVAPVATPTTPTGSSDSSDSDLEFRACVQLLPVRVHRGDLPRAVAEDAIPSLAAYGLSPTTSPGVRAATWAAVARWERPPVDVLVRAIISERSPTIRAALLDALLVSGQDGIGEALTTALDAITESQRFDGIELTRAYAIAYPTVRLLGSLIPALESSDSRRRAAGAYLAGGLRVPESDAQRGKFLALVERLNDEAEGPRYWAHASLRALFGDDFGYDARASEEANANAILAWRTRVIQGDRRP